MIKKETVLFYAKDKDDSMCLAGVYDNYVRAKKSGQPVFSGFMSERKQVMVKSAFSAEKDICLEFFGGYEGAERKMAGFFSGEDVCWPYTVLEAKVKGKNNLTHRDFLGALMSLGIKRDVIGDILISDKTFFFVRDDMAEYIRTNLEKASHSSLTLSVYDGETIEAADKGEDFFETVASLRLDAVASQGFGIARDKSKKLVESGRVTVNGKEIINVDYKIAEGDTISARGFGRFRVKEIKGLSKKGRIILCINK